jgi:putative NADH-flavin reductase
MKIGVIGATGKAGSLIAKEAYNRGNEVTAIVRDKSRLRTKNYKVIEKSIFYLTKDDVKDFDAVVNAFGTPFNKNLEYLHLTTVRCLIDLFEQLPEVRFIMVGGAGSLYTDKSMAHRVVEGIPKEWAGVPTYMAKGLELLRASKVNWTYFSPAKEFDPKGARTGKYTLGTEYVILNEDGESYLSYEDYAVAMMDELEKKSFVRKRFTAVSKRVKKEKEEKEEEVPTVVETVPEEKKDKPKEEDKPAFEGLSQYRGAFVHELANRTFQLIMDNGNDYVIQFLSGEVLEWAEKGQPFKWETYECLKIDEETYFVNFEMTNTPCRIGMTLVFDLEDSLVTAVVAKQKDNKRYPDMVSNEFIFGAIKVDGKKLPLKRHGFTDDLIGKQILWKYSPEFSIVHVYYHSNYIRVGRIPGAPRNIEMEAAFRQHPYDEVCRYIKIKKNIYLVSFCEQNFTKIGKTGNCLTILMDISRLHDVGRSFGLGMGGRPENYLFSAIGKMVESDKTIEAEPSVYRI